MMQTIEFPASRSLIVPRVRFFMPDRNRRQPVRTKYLLLATVNDTNFNYEKDRKCDNRIFCKGNQNRDSKRSIVSP